MEGLFATFECRSEEGASRKGKTAEFGNQNGRDNGHEYRGSPLSHVLCRLMESTVLRFVSPGSALDETGLLPDPFVHLFHGSRHHPQHGHCAGASAVSPLLRRGTLSVHASHLAY